MRVQPEMLKGLLHLLHPDEEQAADEYRKLHQRLVRFFDWNSVEDPCALADVAIDRLAKRATRQGGGVKDPGPTLQTPSVSQDSAGQAGRTGASNPASFALGIARHLLQEEARRHHREAELGRHLQAEAHQMRPIAFAADDSMEDALRACLSKMRKERRELIEAYYSYGNGDRQRTHLALAERLGLSMNALRNRALRTRQDLENCIRGGRP